MGHANEDYFFVRSRHDVPNRIVIHERRIGDRQAVVGVIGAVAKSVKSQRAGVFARYHAHPCGNGDGRDGAFEVAVNSGLDQVADGGHVIPKSLKDQLGRRAIETYDEYFANR